MSVQEEHGSEEVLVVDPERLREEVQVKYEEVATRPDGTFHFFTGRRAARQAGYGYNLLDDLPDRVVEAFAGVANPFSWSMPNPGERVVDIGSGAGLDSVIAARAVGEAGQVIGVEMTEEMLRRSRASATDLGLEQVEFREGFAEDLPIHDGWADLVISNGVFNLIPDKHRAFREVERVLRPGGRLQAADICLQRSVSKSAARDIDLWTG